MFGSDFVRPGLAPKANYNIGLGHTFGFLKKNPFGDELTFAYTYENGGSHGFLHTDFGSHTENIELMKNFSIPRTKRLTGYTWIMGGVGGHHSLRQPQFHLGPGDAQQDCHFPLVHHHQRGIHAEMVELHRFFVVCRPRNRADDTNRSSAPRRRLIK